MNDRKKTEQCCTLSGNSPLTHSLALLGPCIAYSQNSTCFLCRTYHICHACPVFEIIFWCLSFIPQGQGSCLSSSLSPLHWAQCSDTKVCAVTAEGVEVAFVSRAPPCSLPYSFAQASALCCPVRDQKWILRRLAFETWLKRQKRKWMPDMKLIYKSVYLQIFLFS